MFIPYIFGSELLKAIGAAKNFYITVALHMSIQTAIPSKGSGANWTEIRFFTSVRSLMPQQIY